jgi:hypothetical protein
MARRFSPIDSDEGRRVEGRGRTDACDGITSESSHDHHIFSVLTTPVFYHRVSIDIAYDDDALGMIIRYIQYPLVNFIHTIIGQGPISWPCIDHADSSSRSSSSAIPLVTHWRDAQYFS